MTKHFQAFAVAFCFIFMIIFSATAQNRGNIPMLKARFIMGDSAAYSAANYNDDKWETQNTGTVWQAQGHDDYHGFAWYRIHIVIPASLKEKGSWKDSLRLFLAHVNDVDETFLNGKRIGHIGSFPGEAGGYVSKWPAVREYHLPMTDDAIKWDKENVIAIRVYDGGGTGGIFMGTPYIDALEKINGIQIDNSEIDYISSNKATLNLHLTNTYNTTTPGILQYTVFDAESNKNIQTKKIALTLKPFEEKQFKISLPQKEGVEVRTFFKENKSGYAVSESKTLPYILTPAPSLLPKINGATIIGMQPGHPLIYKIAATGEQPLEYSAKDLPAGLQLDINTGIVSGSIGDSGSYAILFTVKNARGKVEKTITIKAGSLLALTPPMGWNSWNCWGIAVTEDKVKSSAQAMIDKGLIDHGWNYINIDDGWEAVKRSTDGQIVTNEKFPDMKSLGNFLHSHGLRFGIYSSPGELTCGGYTGSYQHELSDAKTYAGWGIDYLKYDLCSYLDKIQNKESLTEHQHPYEIMRDALAQQNRDIVYSMCQYGMLDVWKWGRKMNGNLWRTTGDIEDTWESLYNIGFRQNALYPYAAPGGWNDPDMLIVGMVGWGENLHPTRLTADEQYTHISLWSMLSAPLLIGCDMSRLDKFTLNLLTNDEVIAIDQDAAGKQAERVINKDSIQVYVKDLADGTKAIAIFNTSNFYKKYSLNFSEVGLKQNYKVRDVWRQKDIGMGLKSISRKLPPHGVFLFKVRQVIMLPTY